MFAKATNLPAAFTGFAAGGSTIASFSWLSISLNILF